MNIVMFIYNPFRHDSRVLREARTLARAGHEVRVIATRDGLPREERLGALRVWRIDREPWLASAIRTVVDRATARTRSGARPFEPLAAHSPTTDQRSILPKNFGGIPLRMARAAYASLRWLKYCRRAVAAAAREPADVYIAHDLEMLPVAKLACARSG